MRLTTLYSQIKPWQTDIRKIAAVPLASLPPLGSIPTYYVSTDPVTTASLLRADRTEGRKFFDKARPSLLEGHLIKAKNLPIGTSSGNGFSQGNPTICFTAITTYIPAWNAITTIPDYYNKSASASRTCSYINSAPLNRDTTALAALYAAYGVMNLTGSPYKIEMLYPISQQPSTQQQNPEPTISVGFAYFDTNGGVGRLQEVVWVDAVYVTN